MHGICSPQNFGHFIGPSSLVDRGSRRFTVVLGPQLFLEERLSGSVVHDSGKNDLELEDIQ